MQLFSPQMLPTRLLGARTHNLKGVDVDIRPGELCVVTGVSGSGKSSLAMDTLYAEGQRRFVESFSPYARQFLERLERPPMRSLEPVAAGIAVDRRSPIKSSRSTVATMADIEPYLAALFTREALPVCPEHGRVGQLFDTRTAAEQALAAFTGQKVVVTYEERVPSTEGYLEVRDRLIKDGYRRLWLDGRTRDLDSIRPSEVVSQTDTAHVVVDRVKLGRDEKERLHSAVEQAFKLGGARATLHTAADKLELCQGLACPECARELPPARAGLFSYESPLGACGKCRGFGRVLGIDLDRVFDEPSRSLAEGAIRPWRGRSTVWERRELKKLCDRHGISMREPWCQLSHTQQALVLEGDGSWDEGLFPGVNGWFSWLETRTYKMHVRVLLSRYRSYDPCPHCRGQRLNAESLGFVVDGSNLAEWHALPIRDALFRLKQFAPRTSQGELIKSELCSRLGYLERVGLGYLTLERQARTLSGGEAQRVTLTAALGTSLHNALFVLDEPTVGLHPRDIEALCELLRELVSRQNAVLVIEHDPIVIRAADRVIELGPGAGSAGGQIVFDGPPGAAASTQGATARALARSYPQENATNTNPLVDGRKHARAELPQHPPLLIKGAREHNLDGIDVEIPLGALSAITGPSGSGKSTLAEDIVYRSLARRLGYAGVERPGAHEAIEGASSVKRVALVDQSPLGRTSRGNAATYTKAWDSVRRLYAATPSARAQGLTESHFSFNVEKGRCEACAGEGFETVEMQFLADVKLVCPVCRGRRFTESVLAVRYRNLSVAELLQASVDEVLATLGDERNIVRSLKPLSDLGLGYLSLGQPLSTLSGGEAQRLKLARSLRESQKGALLILDEPSTGLHRDEVSRLLDALDLVKHAGGSVLLVEHDPEVIGGVDHVIELGPGSGSEGGRIVATGSPQTLMQTDSLTGATLREHQAASPEPMRPRRALARVSNQLTVTRAFEHNLQQLSVDIPHNRLTILTGPSGSGKSSLAFDVIFAEGQRRFLETLTPYARQFLPTMPRPHVDSVVGVPPSIALEQRTTRAGGRSTVATVTEVAHYLRLLFAKLGVIHCPKHDHPVTNRTLGEFLTEIAKKRERATLLAPAVRARKGTYLDVFSAAHRAGIEHAYCDGTLVGTDNPPRLSRQREHDIDLIVTEPKALCTFTQAELELALTWGNGSLKLRSVRGTELLFSTRGSCPECGFSSPELDPRFFSFNTRQGRCERCDGYGVVEANSVTRRGRSKKRQKQRQAEAQPILTTCPSCQGSRLLPLPRRVQLKGHAFGDVSQQSVKALLKLIETLRFTKSEQAIAKPVVSELLRRLRFLRDVGLDYLTLDRAAASLSGGELQRLRLAAQLGAGLTGALYVLDEPTIGLHPADTHRLIENLRKLVDLGSTILVVEHDEEMIRHADHLIDLGPGGGRNGGHVVAVGAPEAVLKSSVSPTGRAFSIPTALRRPLPIKERDPELTLFDAHEHNLKHVDYRVKLGRFNVIAGVSGSGKSTLVRKVLLPALRQKLGLSADAAGAHSRLTGYELLRRAISVDQSPIGRTPRSVPATFLGIWDFIRQLFASSPDARQRGFEKARFSFNAKAGGRCEQCTGQGYITHEMSFLPDVIQPCATCDGQRFEPLTLAVTYKGLNIGQVLALSAEQAARVFEHHRKIAEPLSTLCDLGAGYIALGQGSHTLSGGEAQRLKLAAELTASVRHEPTLYVLDEPTTGLHQSDVDKLMDVLSRLVDRGDTLVVIEHHPRVIAGADHVVELGPKGGTEGGSIVFAGPPQKLAQRKSPTGRVLRSLHGESRPSAMPASRMLSLS